MERKLATPESAEICGKQAAAVRVMLERKGNVVPFGNFTLQLLSLTQSDLGR